MQFSSNEIQLLDRKQQAQENPNTEMQRVSYTDQQDLVNTVTLSVSSVIRVLSSFKMFYLNMKHLKKISIAIELVRFTWLAFWILAKTLHFSYRLFIKNIILFN